MPFYVGSPSQFYKKKLLNKYTKKYGIFNYSREHSKSIKVLKQAGVVHNIKSQ